MICPICKKENQDDSNFCEKCGRKIPRCPTCGKVIDKKIRFCFNDGTPLPDEILNLLPDEQPETISPTVAERIEATQTASQKKNRTIPILIISISLVCVLLIGVLIYLTVSGTFDSLMDDFGISSFLPAQDRDGTEEPEQTEEETTPETEEETIPATDALEETLPTEPVTETTDPVTETEPTVPVMAESIAMTCISDFYASSSLSEYNMTHSPDRLFDNDLSTAWVEGVTGHGVNERIVISFDNVYTVTGININAGYQKNDDIYQKNSRPKEIQVKYSDGTTETIKLEDTMTVQRVLLSAPVETESITISIVSVYPGSKYEDTAISEISFF